MPKQKTYLTPEQQWDKTSRLGPFRWELNLEQEMRPSGFLLWGRYKVLDKALEVWGMDRIQASSRFTMVNIGAIRYNCREFLKGDLVLVEINNNSLIRLPVHGVSSKGRHWRHRYISMCRWNTGSKRPEKVRNSGPLYVFDHPDELVGCRPSDPVVRAWVHEKLLSGRAGLASNVLEETGVGR